MLKLLKKSVWNPIVNSARPKFCGRMLDHALSKRWPVEKIHEPFKLEFSVPDSEGIPQNIKDTLERHGRIEFPAQYLVCIPGASTLGGLVKIPSGEFLAESDWRVRDFKLSDISRSRFRRHKLSLDGDCYYLDLLFSANYGHWLSDEMPKLATALPFLPPATQFIISDPIQQFKLESLSALGIGRDRLIPVKGYYETRCERLWHATPVNDMVWNAKMVRQVREALLQTHGQGSEPSPERIFISRNSVHMKRLANEDELLPLVESYGYKVIRPENHTLAQQVKIFSKARQVMGAYGAGLTNLLFCPPARLFELQDSHFAPRPWFWKWATMLGHDYGSIMGPMTENLTDYLDTRFTIHPDPLKQYLESSLSAADGRPGKQWMVSQ